MAQVLIARVWVGGLHHPPPENDPGRGWVAVHTIVFPEGDVYVVPLRSDSPLLPKWEELLNDIEQYHAGGTGLYPPAGDARLGADVYELPPYWTQVLRAWAQAAGLQVAQAQPGDDGD